VFQVRYGDKQNIGDLERKLKLQFRWNQNISKRKDIIYRKASVSLKYFNVWYGKMQWEGGMCFCFHEYSNIMLLLYPTIAKDNHIYENNEMNLQKFTFIFGT